MNFYIPIKRIPTYCGWPAAESVPMWPRCESHPVVQRDSFQPVDDNLLVDTCAAMVTMDVDVWNNEV